MTSWFESVNHLARRVGGIRKLMLILTLAILVTVFLLDVLTPWGMLDPLLYLYITLGAVAALYLVYPLYVNRRLASYYWERVKRNKLAVWGLAFIIFLILLAVIGPFFTADPTAGKSEERNLPPPGFTITESIYDRQAGELITRIIAGTWKHPLGTDDKGRDLLAMIISGAGVSLQVGLLATGIAVAIGTLIGAISAYLGGKMDNALMRFTDIMMTFPFFLLLVLMVFIFGSNLALLVTIIGLTGWTGIARLIRSEVLSLRTREFIMAARALGASDKRIILAHLIPNVVSLIIVISTLSIPGVIVAEAALSFIGLGDPSVTSWGMVLKAGQQNLDTAWWVALAPGLMLFLTVLAFNFLGDGLRDAFDPRSAV